MITISPGISIDEDELQERFIRASGPGGQNVNKVATAVQLRFDAGRSPSLPADVRQRLAALAGRRQTSEGVIVIEASRFRTREQNRRDALARLIDLIRRAGARPKPRHKTRPTRAANQRRLDSKRRRSQAKQMRSRPGGEQE